jgi:hypothetical protein
VDDTYGQMSVLFTIGSLKSSPQPIITLLLVGFGIGIFGHLSGSRVLIVIGIAMVFVAGLLAPQY